MTRRLAIKETLWRNHLTNVWLVAQLEKCGMEVSQTEFSQALTGARQNVKSEMIIDRALEVLADYERRMNDT